MKISLRTFVFIDALQPQRVAFKSEQDELDACVAAMRSKSLLFSVLHDGAMVSNGFR